MIKKRKKIHVLLIELRQCVIIELVFLVSTKQRNTQKKPLKRFWWMARHEKETFRANSKSNIIYALEA